MTDSTAIYLARRMFAERGYRPGSVPEAQPLIDAADLVLTRADGMSLQILLIIDRETHPERRFPLTQDAVVTAANACLEYTGTMNGAKLPVSVAIWEVGPHTTAEPELTRLKALARNWPGAQKVVVTAWALDTASKNVRTTARLGGLLSGRRFLARCLREPRLPEDLLVPQPPAALQDAGFPWLTCTMIAALTLVFAAEHLFAVAPWHGALAPDVLTLIALGGLDQASVTAGDWFRLWTAATLHADILHLVFNSVALYIGGAVLEGLLGRAWLLAVFLLGALGGSLLSYSLNPTNIVSVGASGAIMALLTAAFVSSFRLPDGPLRTPLQMSLLQMGIPALLPLFMGVDYAAHLGGALTGALLGLLLLRTWPRSEPLPKFRRLALLLNIAGLAALTHGAVRLAQTHHDYTGVATARTLYKNLIPDADLPNTDADMTARAEKLAADYPHDPRAHLANALRLANTGDPTGAAANLRLGLAETEILQTFFSDRQLETVMRALLAEILQTQNQPEAAREAAAPVCTAGPDGATPEPLRPLGVCP